MTSGKRLLSKVKPSATLFSAVGNGYRMAILVLVHKKPMREVDVVKRLKIPQNLVSHHIGILYTSGWIMKKRVGSLLFYIPGKKAPKLLWQWIEELKVFKSR